MNSARHNIYTKMDKPPHVKCLPPTDANLLFHMLTVHHQTMLWKAADQENNPELNITEFSCEVFIDILSLK